MEESITIYIIIAIVSLIFEYIGAICFVAFISYLFLEGNICWKLVIATSIDSILAAPFAAITVKKFNSEKLKLIIGIATIILGISTIIKIFI
jgi:uncharacterized protein